MSEPSLNELQTKIIKLDKPNDEKSASTGLNILSTAIKKTNQNSIFIVPGQTSNPASSSNLTTVTLVNDTLTPTNSSKQTSTISNKITLIPFNLNASKPTPSTTTTPIKIINDLTATSPTQPKTTIISSLSNAKKLIQINSNPTALSPIRSNLLANLERSPQSSTTNTKIFTISNGGINSKANSNIPITNTSNNNKIQYVKIVNTPQTSSGSLLSQQTNNVPTNTTAIKITTISTNPNNGNSLNNSTNNANHVIFILKKQNI